MSAKHSATTQSANQSVDNIALRYLELPLADGSTAKVAEVSLARPDKLNGLTLPMLVRLSKLARELGKDAELRGVILRGEGSSFCAGLDFAEAFKVPAKAFAGFVPDIYGTGLFQRCCWDWRRIPVPVIAVVHGHCLGGGVQIALGADFRVSTSDAKWSVLETKWGLIPDMSGMRTLNDATDLDTAKWLAMSGEMFSGAQAKDMNLATWVIEGADAAYELAEEKLAALAERSPDQLAATKRLFRTVVNKGPRATFRAERLEQIGLFLRKNTAIARDAALKKVAPRYVRRGTWAGH